jgi:hypothetical protein
VFEEVGSRRGGGAPKLCNVSLGQMTDIPDLLDTPQARLAYRMQDFVERLRDRNREEERQMDLLIEKCRTRLHRLHLKTESVYKDLYNDILRKLNHNEDAEILEWFEFILKTERKDLIQDVLERAKGPIQEIERSGGKLAVDISKEGDGRSGCIYSDPRRSYFSFIDEFLDGFDDGYVYVVKKVQKSEAEQEKERDARLEAHVAKWRAKERASRVDWDTLPSTIAASEGQLREVPVEEAVGSFPPAK